MLIHLVRATTPQNIHKRKKAFKCSRSAHQKQMRVWAISLMLVVLALFTTLFYLINQQIIAASP